MKTFFLSLKRSVLALSTLFCLGMNSTAFGQTDGLKGNSAIDIMKNIKVGWNLGNSLDATGGSGLTSETSWGNPKTTQRLIDSVKAAGFNAIRVPVSWGTHTSNNGTYTYAVDAQWMARVKEVVDYCYNRGMYVIINLHHDDSYFFPSSDKLNNSTLYVKEMWTQIAHEFANYDQHLIFETLNEPRLVGDTYEWWFVKNYPSSQVSDAISCINSLNQTAVSAIRSVNEGYNLDRVISCPGYDASIDGCTVSTFQMPTDNVSNRLCVSIHAYLPYNFCASTDQSNADFRTFTSSDASQILDLYRQISSSFTSKGIAAYIGETGCSNKDDREEIAKWVACFFGYSKSYSIPCFLWDNDNFYKGGAYSAEYFGLLNRSTLTWGEQSTIDAVMTTLGITPGDVIETLANSTSVYASQGRLYASCSATINRIEVYGINGTALSSVQFGGETSAELELPALQSRVAIVVIYTSAGKVVKKVMLQ
jgi:endoglucanase